MWYLKRLRFVLSFHMALFYQQLVNKNCHKTFIDIPIDKRSTRNNRIFISGTQVVSRTMEVLGWYSTRATISHYFFRLLDC